jgi:hypothetical protein
VDENSLIHGRVRALSFHHIAGTDLRLVHTIGQDTVKSRTGQGHILTGEFTGLDNDHEHEVACTRMSDSSDVEVFIFLAAVCEEIEKK